jgi:hypothetical protein
MSKCTIINQTRLHRGSHCELCNVTVCVWMQVVLIIGISVLMAISTGRSAVEETCRPQFTAVTRSDHLTARVCQRQRFILLTAVTATICEECVHSTMLPGFLYHWTYCMKCLLPSWRPSIKLRDTSETTAVFIHDTQISVRSLNSFQFT